MCLYPTVIRNRKYTRTIKNGGNIPPLTDPRVQYIPIGCQQCIECRKQKARAWQLRLLEDIKTNRNGKFITLTFSNEAIAELTTAIHEQREEIENTYDIKLKPTDGYDLDNEIATLAMRRFLERYRKEFGKSIRHWMVTELGHEGTENIHIHGILWTDTPLQQIETIWKYGFVWKGKMIQDKIINYVNESTVTYITKYIYKADIDHVEYKAKVLTSPGIGRNYTQGHDWHKNKYTGATTKEYYRSRTGHKIAMPTYWRNKIYSDQDREKLWLQRLDKCERWICGEKVNIRNGEESYYRNLNYHRKENARLGYGDGSTNWTRAEYEKQRRNLLTQQRIQSASPAGQLNMNTD